MTGRLQMGPSLPLLLLVSARLVAPHSEGAAWAESSALLQGRHLERIGAVLDWRDRVEPENQALRERLEELLPRLMREVGLDMWLVVNREYAEDPVYFSLVPAPIFAARRTTMLMFFDRGDSGVERLTVSRYPLGDLYEKAWEGGNLEEQWQRLAELVRERSPRRIGVNSSRHWAVADGLSSSLHQRLLEVLGPELGDRVESAERLVIRWLETRSKSELERYPHVVALARGVIAEALSEQVITPGVTTTQDVAWFIRQRFADLHLPVWFMPYVNVQRPGMECALATPFCGDNDEIIRRGDVLHTDVGICYLRLCTDTQEMGYVLRVGEEEVPAGLQHALRVGNEWQDLLTVQFRAGRTGNEVLAETRQAAALRDMRASVYTHPLGVFGHAPGPTIGMWDNQGPTPIQGDWPLYPDTAFAIEGNVKVEVPEWSGQWVQIKLEQSAVYDGQEVTYLAGRQTAWHIVR